MSGGQTLALGGVAVAAIVVQLTLAMGLTVLVSYLLLRLGFFALVWHRPLVEVSIFCIFLGALVVLTPSGLPLAAPHAASEPSGK